MAKYDTAIKDCDSGMTTLEKLAFPPNSPSAMETSASAEDMKDSIHSAMFVKLVLRRADCWAKLEKWEECVRDYTLADSLKPRDAGKNKMRGNL